MEETVQLPFWRSNPRMTMIGSLTALTLVLLLTFTAIQCTGIGVATMFLLVILAVGFMIAELSTMMKGQGYRTLGIGGMIATFVVGTWLLNMAVQVCVV